MFNNNYGCRNRQSMPYINCESYTLSMRPECEISALTMNLVPNVSTAAVCEFVTYTLTITNNCSSSLTKPILNVNLGNSLCYNKGTLTVDGTAKADVTCLQNLVLDDLNSGATVTITFQARVMNSRRYNICNASLTYALSCCCLTRCYKTISNDALVQVCQCCSSQTTSV